MRNRPEFRVGSTTTLTASVLIDLVTRFENLVTLNRPGMSGDSASWEGWSHVRWFVEEVPAGAA